MNTKNRIVKAGAIEASPEVIAPLGASIDESLASGGVVPPAPDLIVGEQSIEEVIVKPKRAKVEPSEPRPATVAEMMAQSLRQHQEHTDRAAALAELQKQLKNL